MTRFLIFIVIINVILGATTTMNNALRNQVVIDFKNAIVPIISKQIEHVRLPDIKGKQSGIHYEITNIDIYVNPINPSQINVQFVSGSTLKFSGTSFGMRGSAKAKVKWTIISKTVSVSISISNAGFSTSIALKAVNNKPNIQITQFDLSISSGNVHISVSGGLIGKVINLIVGLMKGHIVSNVVSGIRGSAPGIITKKVNSILDKLPSDIKITNNIYMKYEFPVAPVIRNGYMFTGIVAYLHPANDPSPPPGPMRPIPEFDANNARGVQFFISDYVVRSALNAAFKLNLLYININRKISNRQVIMSCKVDKLPDFAFDNAIQATASGICDVALDNDPTPKFQLLATIQLVLQEKIKNAIIFFSGDKLTFSKLDFKIIKPVDIEWFKNAINEVFKVVLEVINGELGQKGIPLPTIKEMDYTDIIQYIGAGFTMVGTTPVFHINMDEEPGLLFDHSSETVIIEDDTDFTDDKELYQMDN
jgi:hypothetical protein